MLPVADQAVNKLRRERRGHFQQRLSDVFRLRFPVGRRGAQQLAAVPQRRHPRGAGERLFGFPEIAVQQHEYMDGACVNRVVVRRFEQPLADFDRFRPVRVAFVLVIAVLHIAFFIVIHPFVMPPPAGLRQRVGQRNEQPLVLRELRKRLAQQGQAFVHPAVVAARPDAERVDSGDDGVDFFVALGRIAEQVVYGNAEIIRQLRKVLDVRAAFPRFP